MPNCNIPNCEVIRRLCMEPYKDEEPKMHTLYGCYGKYGTTSSTKLWFMSEPKVGEVVFGIDETKDRVSPYMKGHAFRYAKFSTIMIDNIYENGYVICHMN